MRAKGKLTRWNDERGFGFIAPMEGGAEVFVHVSAFPRDGRRPEVGDVLTYEVVPGKDGRPRAVGIARPGAPGPAPVPARRAGRAAPSGPRPSVVVSLAIIVVSVAVLGWEYRRNSQRAADEADEAAVSPAQFAVEDADAGRRCDGRTRCSQMTSCAEATWFLEHCPGVKMDGNGDGVPCERQWCGE